MPHSILGAGKQKTYIAWPYDCACPVSHVNVIAVVHAIANKSIANALLPFLKLL